GVLFAWSFVDPHLNVPLVSSIVCRLKGGVFYDEPNVLLGVEAPGCYRVGTSPGPNGSGRSSGSTSTKPTEPPTPYGDVPWSFDFDGDGRWTKAECWAVGGMPVGNGYFGKRASGTIACWKPAEWEPPSTTAITD